MISKLVNVLVILGNNCNLTFMLNTQYLEQIDGARKDHNLFTVGDLLEMQNLKNNIFLDPFSCLISNNVRIGIGNIFYSNITILSQEDSIVDIGNENTFFPQTCIRLAKSANLVLGSNIQLGDGGVLMRLTSDNVVRLEDKSRLIGGVQIIGSLTCGIGSQILGQIVIKNCILDGGKDSSEPNADLRGAVLKGFGVADSLRVPTGKVIYGHGIFKEDALENQSFYHPLPSTEVSAS
ncbi:MAG: hypothetical protein JWM56_601 [Candidatus Peribacteria bacterium]|nr:hypothetical protein [Candidatus Peribacteria bacterium]